MVGHYDNFLAAMLGMEAELESDHNLWQLPGEKLAGKMRARINVYIGEAMVARQKYMTEGIDAAESPLDPEYIGHGRKIEYIRRDFDGPAYDF